MAHFLPSPIATKSKREGETPMARTPRILIVDDSPDLAQMFARFLNRLGYETQTVADGLQAIAVAEKFCPQFVLLDIGMPNLNGFEAAKRLRNKPWSKGMVLIAISGHWNEQYQRWARQAGFDAYMVKPVALKDIADLINTFSQAERQKLSKQRKRRQVTLSRVGGPYFL